MTSRRGQPSHQQRQQSPISMANPAQRNDYILISSDDERYDSGNEFPATFASSPALGIASADSRVKRSRTSHSRSRVSSPDIDTPNDHRFPDKKSALTKVLELFPDISHGHVGQLFDAQVQENPGVHADLIDQYLIDGIIEAGGAYPKQKDVLKAEMAQKRDGRELWTSHGECVLNESASLTAYKMLAAAFTRVPTQCVHRLFHKREKDLFATYLDLHRMEGMYDECGANEYVRLRRSRGGKMSSHNWPNTNDPMTSLLKACWAAAEEEARNEDKRFQEAAEMPQSTSPQTAGPDVECQCCFTDYPLSQAIECESDAGHFFCRSCFESYAKAQIGAMNGQLVCFSTDGCKAKFSSSDIKRVLNFTMANKLENLQQEEAIKLAEIDGLVECPFCDFKAICVSVEIDREFRCGKCEQISCRLCRSETHIPKSCEEAEKDRRPDARHLVEEAMSEALIRVCPNPACKAPIIKEYGCNKMACARCFRIMCYICRKDITGKGYQHFKPTDSGNSNNKCVLHDMNSERLHDDEVEKAEANAIKELMAKNPSFKQEELKVNDEKHPNLKRTYSAMQGDHRQPYERAYDALNADHLPGDRFLNAARNVVLRAQRGMEGANNLPNDHHQLFRGLQHREFGPVGGADPNGIIDNDAMFGLPRAFQLQAADLPEFYDFPQRPGLEAAGPGMQANGPDGRANNFGNFEQDQPPYGLFPIEFPIDRRPPNPANRGNEMQAVGGAMREPPIFGQPGALFNDRQNRERLANHMARFGDVFVPPRSPAQAQPRHPRHPTQ